MQHVVKRFARKARQQRVKFLRFENQQHHASVMVREGLRDASLFACFGSAAITTYHVGRTDGLLLLATAFSQCDGGASLVLRDGV